MKRIVILSDLHCGHRSGLTPPAYQFREGDGHRDKYAILQAEMWKWYETHIAACGEIDTLIVNGDAIDGKNERQGSTELITADPKEQIDMAVKCIEQANAKKVVLVYGTFYHVGKETDYETIIAELIEAETEVKNHAFVEAEGLMFDCKHKVSSSVVPYGRFTGPSRDRLWNLLWAERGEQPKANITIRSHVHYFTSAMDRNGVVMTTPALQGPSTKYGARMHSGTVDVGFLAFDCENGSYSFVPHFMDMRFAPSEIISA